MRGGFGTKACTIYDGQGRALALALLPGQGHELTAAPSLPAPARQLGPIGRVIYDRVYSAQHWRNRIEAAGAEPGAPSQPTHRPVLYDRAAYARRHRVENLWARLKEWRAIATRYDKTAQSFLGVLQLAASLDWLSNRP